MFSMSPFPPTSIVVVDHLSSSFTLIMAPKRSSSKDTSESSTSKEVVRTLMKLQIFKDTQLFKEKEFDITWHKLYEALPARNFKSYLKDRQVYINVQNSGLHKVSCKCLNF